MLFISWPVLKYLGLAVLLTMVAFFLCVDIFSDDPEDPVNYNPNSHMFAPSQDYNRRQFNRDFDRTCRGGGGGKPSKNKKATKTNIRHQHHQQSSSGRIQQQQQQQHERANREVERSNNTREQAAVMQTAHGGPGDSRTSSPDELKDEGVRYYQAILKGTRTVKSVSQYFGGE